MLSPSPRLPIILSSFPQGLSSHFPYEPRASGTQSVVSEIPHGTFAPGSPQGGSTQGCSKRPKKCCNSEEEPILFVQCRHLGFFYFLPSLHFFGLLAHSPIHSTNCSSTLVKVGDSQKETKCKLALLLSLLYVGILHHSNFTQEFAPQQQYGLDISVFHMGQ